MAVAELIAKLEAATGPDRELDARIEVHRRMMLGLLASVPFATFTPRGYVVNDETQETICIAPRYTASLDAALTLVPEGWWVTIKLCRNELMKRDNVYHYELERDADIADRDLVNGEALSISVNNISSNAAVATCLAALRAREAT